MSPSPVRGFFSRPLLFLTPFFIAGLAVGPDLAPAGPWLRPALVLTALLLVLASRGGRGLPLVPAGLLLGLIGAATTMTLYQAPMEPEHVFHLRERPDLVFGGRVVEPPRMSEGRARLVVSAEEVLEVGGRPRPAQGRIYLSMAADRPPAGIGDRVRFPAKLRRIVGFGNPGGFDFERHWAGQGVRVSAFLESPRLLAVYRATEEGFSPRYWLGRLRGRAAGFLERNLNQPARGLVKALTLGDQDDIEPEIREGFRRLGLAHLLAISGLHVGLVALAAYWLILKLLLLGPDWALRWDLHRTARLLALVPVLFYASLAGGRPSTTRAAVMVVVFMLALSAGRGRDPLTALAAAALAVLAFLPGSVFTASFQLSFAAAGGIILLAPRFPASPFAGPTSQDEAPPRAGPLIRAWGLVIISASALLATGPIAAYHFQRFPALSLPANLVFTPLVSLAVVPAGLVALALPGLAGPVLFILERFIWILLASIEPIGAWPGVELVIPRPGLPFMTAYYLALTAAVVVRPCKKKVLAVGALLCVYGLFLGASHVVENTKPRLRVTFLDVGQGSAAFLSLPERGRMVIDGGGFAQSSFDTGEAIIAPFLLDQGVTRLDVLALSHPQADHVGGLPFLARTFKPAELWTNHAPSRNADHQALLEIAAAMGIRHPALAELYRPRAFGPARVLALAPAPNFIRHYTRREIMAGQNDLSLVLKVEMGRRSVLFPGDLEAEGVADLLARQPGRLRADVLLAPHHGSAAAMTPALLEAVRPEIVVFSAGPFNRFGFPSPDAQALVRAFGARIFRTDRDGAVTVTTDGESLEVETFR
ncbi:MAG: DNA internalization-related competence protein ComEC/Rec2 [Proteobacteria bacterium]|nr:DNA internalization-related competence protein ComEC/Rec2 [Pseudomonadota bacterium]